MTTTTFTNTVTLTDEDWFNDVDRVVYDIFDDPADAAAVNNKLPIAQNSQSAAYTTVLADANKHILHPTADNNARTFTIDSNTNVAYPIGTTLTFVNQINTLTIAIVPIALSGVTITGTEGQFGCNSATLAVNQLVTISGTYGGTGSITGYVNQTTYKISATNGSTTFTLVTTADVALVTTAGTPTGLTYDISETLTWAGVGTRGNRTLAANGMATALKVATALWFIAGNGLS